MVLILLPWKVSVSKLHLNPAEEHKFGGEETQGKRNFSFTNVNLKI